jgi:hypothetical protein
MTDAITIGSLFIDDRGYLPNAALLQREPHSSGWAEVTNDRSTFEKELPEAGWTCFFMAGEIRTTVFGFDREKSLGNALIRLIADVKGLNCNCIQITQVKGSSFLKVPYVTVSAHAWHLQKGRTFVSQK